MEELELRHVCPSRPAVSPELRALMEKARTNVADMLNVKLTPAEQVWSRQLYYMLSLSTSGEAQRRLQNVPEGEGAEGVERYSLSITSRRQPRGMSECSGRFSCMTSGSSHNSSIGSNSSGTLSGSTRSRRGESVTDKRAAGRVPGWHQGCCDQRPPGSPCG